ncbi:MAG: DUF4290 domain-containing protein [Bacteroidales bacterium]|nr:DUF4290 domain-containing protein [Bacteroidales bacterium]
MEYNTSKKKIITKEYGRNIQQMVEYLMSIQDRDLRNQQAKSVIRTMACLSNGSKKTADFWQKLWDELFVISDYRLDIDSPFPIPAKKDVVSKPNHINYPDHRIHAPAYGKNIEKCIHQLATEADSPKKENTIKEIATYMKILYLNYNRDSVSDDLIRDHLHLLSKGKLELDKEVVLPSTKSLLAKEEEADTGKKKFKAQAKPAQPSKKKKKKKKNGYKFQNPMI